jgi:serine/threonine protein kinase
MGSSSSPKPPDVAAVHNTALAQSHDTDDEILAYWPQRRLQDAIYGSVWACLVLRRHFGVAADDAARAAGVEPGSAAAPMVWEITGAHVAIKMIEWARVHHMRGRLLEDPVKEVAAMQMLGGHPNVLSSSEVLQDSDFLYSIMPFCRDGDLFGIVVKYAEDSGGEIGMPEPVARYWFRQILSVRCISLSYAFCSKFVCSPRNTYSRLVYRDSIIYNTWVFATAICPWKMSWWIMIAALSWTWVCASVSRTRIRQTRSKLWM